MDVGCLGGEAQEPVSAEIEVTLAGIDAGDGRVTGREMRRRRHGAHTLELLLSYFGVSSGPVQVVTDATRGGEAQDEGGS